MALDTSKLALIGGAAGFAWYMGWLAPLGIPGPATSSPASSPAPTGGTPPTSPPKLNCTAPLVPSADGTTCVTPPPPPPKLADLYTQLVNAVGAAVASGQDVRNPDNYNALLTNIYPPAGPLPDPNQLFGSTGWVRPNDMPIAAYWAVTSDWLSKNKGLSGFRGYAGLGAIAMRHGWGF